jgi:polyisoprenyl-phosphate glycosyltransferase
VALFAVVFGAQLVLRTLLFGNPVPGYPSLMTVVLWLGGVQLVPSRKWLKFRVV